MKHVSMLGIAMVSLACLLVAGDAQSQSVRVKGHLKSSGTYVLPHYRTSPDSSKFNNWSTKGNINPYTGKSGTKSAFSFGSSSKSSWSLGRTKF